MVDFQNSLLDKLKDIFFGANDWEERLQPEIKFTSPEGNAFSAKWQGSPRSLDKKLGIYIYPKVKGNVIDDLDVNSDRYSITFYFDGKNNDLTARAFFQAAKERGPWEVIHPVHGFIELQLVSITENDEPVFNGNITAFDSEWIEPIDPETLKTARELKGIVDGLSQDLNISAVQQFANKVKQTTTTFRNAIETTTKGIENLSDFVLDPLRTIVDEIYLTTNALKDGIDDIFNSTVLQLESLGGQIQELLELPALASNDLESRIDTYTDLTLGLMQILPGGTNPAITSTASATERANSALNVELGLNAALVALAQIAVTSTNIKTKVQAIGAAENIINNFNTGVEALEAVQEDLDVQPIDLQFFAQSESYPNAALLVMQTVRYLLSVAFDLRVERRFTLTKPRAPIEIAINEYGDIGENDSNFELFISSNNLKGSEILLLPAGKEVVIYD